MSIPRRFIQLMSLWFGGCLSLAVTMAENLQQPTVTNVYKNDFQKAVDGQIWSLGGLMEIPTGGKMLKGWSEMKFTLSAFPAHQFLRVRIKLATVVAHDGFEPGPGPDHWVILDGAGTSLFHTNFRTIEAAHKRAAGEFGQAFPDEFPAGRNPAQTGAIDVGKLGFGHDASYQIEICSWSFFRGTPTPKTARVTASDPSRSMRCLAPRSRPNPNWQSCGRH